MMPESLFLKIFLWFWLAMTLVGATLVLTTEITQPEVRLPRWREFTGDTISYYAERSADVLEQGGREALDDYLEESQFNLYPNPSTSGLFNLNLIFKKQPSYLQIKVTDIMGKSVLEV